MGKTLAAGGARPAGRPSVPQFPPTLVVLGREQSRGYGRVGIGRSALAGKTFIAAARMSCGFQLIGASRRVHVAAASISSGLHPCGIPRAARTLSVLKLRNSKEIG